MYVCVSVCVHVRVSVCEWQLLKRSCTIQRTTSWPWWVSRGQFAERNYGTFLLLIYAHKKCTRQSSATICQICQTLVHLSHCFWMITFKWIPIDDILTLLATDFAYKDRHSTYICTWIDWILSSLDSQVD